MPLDPRSRVKRGDIQYPYIVQETRDGWEVLYVRTDRPYQVANFDEESDAENYANGRNKEWRVEQDALLQARLAIFRINEKIDSINGGTWIHRMRRGCKWLRREK